MEWILDNLGLVVVVTIAALSSLRGMFGSKEAEERPKPRRIHGEEDAAAAERTRRVQEEIRRKIAERRTAAAEAFERHQPEPEFVEAQRERIPPLMRPQHLPPVDPFGGPMRKIVRRMEEAAERRFEPAENFEATEALARQRRLDEEMRELEAARVMAVRRAAELAAKRADQEAHSPRLGVPVRGDSLRDELRDPRQLRRAFLLREVLGTPVGLR